MEQFAVLAALVFLASILYSSVGHAGASAYLAAMALMSVPPEVMKPTALCLNVLVASITTARFAWAGHFSWSIFWPFAAASIPCAFVGGRIQLPGQYYKVAVGVVLLFAAARLITAAIKHVQGVVAPPRASVALAVGAGLGLLSGLTGTGGGIFLSPLLLLAGWAEVRQCAAVSAAFVLVNSLAGLAGNWTSMHHLPPQIVGLAVVVTFGGIIGSELGTRYLAPAMMKYLLGAVLLIAGFKLIFA